MTLQVFVHSELYQAGTTEDGEAFIAEYFKVYAESENGSRWFHTSSFESAEAHSECDENGCEILGFENLYEEAKAKAERLASRVAAHLDAGGKLDPEHWVETDPRYGSSAYDSLDSVGYFKDREKMEEAEAA